MYICTYSLQSITRIGWPEMGLVEESRHRRRGREGQGGGTHQYAHLERKKKANTERQAFPLLHHAVF